MHKRIALIVFVLCFGFVHAAPLDTSFTFQGQLQEAAVPAVGDYEFEFELFDAASGGLSTSAIIGQTLTVDDGIFTTRLDFGDAPFVGDAVWLEVRVRALGGGAYTALAPRQAIVNAPYALHAQFVGADSVTGGSVVDGSLGGQDLAAGSVGASEVDASEVQLRLAGACAAGQAIRAVDANGSVTCTVLDDGDWISSGSLNATDKRVAIGVAGTTDAQLLVHSDSDNGRPQIELREVGQDSGRLIFRTTGPAGEEHFNYWMIAARTEPDSFGGPDTDRINFFNNRSGDLMALLGNGNLGLGPITPTARLDVDGNVRVRSLGGGGSPSRPVHVDDGGLLVALDPPATRRVAVSFAEFKPSDSAFGYQSLSGRFRINPGTGTPAVADVQVPDGATMTTLRVYIYDNSATRNLEVRLLKQLPTTNSVLNLAQVTSSGAGSGLQYREFTDSIGAGFYSAETTLFLFISPVDAVSGLGSVWDADLGISAAIVEFTPPQL